MNKTSSLSFHPFVPAAGLSTDSRKAPQQIRIKTLEEIRKEKAAKSVSQQSAAAPEGGDGKTGKDLRHIIVATHPVAKTRSTGRKEQEEATTSTTKLLVKRTVPPEPSPLAAAPHQGGVQVKTLEEIRREKVARTEAETRKSSASHSCSGKNPRLQPARKAASHGKNGAAPRRAAPL